MDCGPACLKMVAAFYGIHTEISNLRELCNTSRLGTNIGDIVHAAERIGLKSLVFKTTTDYLSEKQPFPCILHWRKNHYAVLYKIKNDRFTIGDPGHGITTLSRHEFIEGWLDKHEKGIALFIEPDVETNRTTTMQWIQKKTIFQQFVGFLTPHRKQIILLCLIIIITSTISLLIPKTIQFMTDQGIGKKNISIIWKALIFQFVLFGSLTLSNYLRSFIQTKLSTKLSITIISDFLIKLLRLPISFFDTKNHADIYQRINDHSRIESFLSTRLVSFIFSGVLVITYLFQFFWFDKYIVLCFLSFTVLSFIWFFLFMEKRKNLDYRRFGLAIEERHYLNDLISGMTEIKLNNAQLGKVYRWKILQDKLYSFKLKSLKLTNVQQNGINTVNQIKSISITFLCSYWVINGSITFGVMLSIGYIVGQLTVPIGDIMSFFNDYQDAKISFERLNEVQLKADENDESKIGFPDKFSNGFKITNVSFKYAGFQSPYILRGVNAIIPKGKITAIVGTSGSGKTTLMKLLLSFYSPQEGNIAIDNINLQNINTDQLRSQCGVVMQDGYIYNSSIAQNVAMDDNNIDIDKVLHALKIACLFEFVDLLPQKHDTLLGTVGVDLSGGQRQRLFIARSVYKDPQIIFFDEATNSLDTNNERAIMENLEHFFIGKTVVVIAHRLSTVRNADQIIVLEKGEIVEAGSHLTLTKDRGKYFELVKNQLELGT
ncbi:MAG: transporter ATP-binding protein [Mucilaginibacter sp.]|nr:transporter ATP-binding protein [Mucilaginibacter sp.]